MYVIAAAFVRISYMLDVYPVLLHDKNFIDLYQMLRLQLELISRPASLILNVIGSERPILEKKARDFYKEFYYPLINYTGFINGSS